MNKIKVLVVDDSALVRDILKKGLSNDPGIEVIDVASDVYSARDKIVLKKPDVITLDLEMPRMDGLTFLKRLMPQYPLPVVIVSALAEPGAKTTLDALEFGAIDYVLKPTTKIGTQLSDMIEDLILKIKVAAQVDVSKWKDFANIKQAQPRLLRSPSLSTTTDKLIAIGASTGGTKALGHIINELPPDIPGTIIVQHMPPVFTQLFALRLNEKARVEVKEAQTGDRIQSGRVLIAPGGQHLEVTRSGAFYLARCRKGEKVNGHCPSVDVMFNSVARNVGSNAIGVLLTGMGKDGAQALLNMKNKGAKTLVQDEASSVVYGMPKAAVECGAAEKQVSLENMAQSILETLEAMK
jgi:two-component system, chemotaxis family, protein-glutamate methylesterase/glutaminase